MRTAFANYEWKVFAIIVVAALVSGPALGQGVDVPITNPRVPANTSVDVQYAHFFKAETDNRGKVDRDSASFVVGHRVALSDTVGVRVQGGYQLSAYDFSGSPSPGTGAFQWDDVHEIRGIALFDMKLDERWSLIAGGAVFSHAEGGGDFGEGVTAGALVGFDYQANEDLKLGLVIGAATALESSATLFPIPRVDWKFADNWRWRVDSILSFGGRGIGTELSVHPTEEIEIAVGISRQRRRFRLDDRPGLKDGVGEESSMPAFVRLGYKASPNLVLDVMAGVAFNGQLRIESKTGNQIESDNYDPAPVLGIGGLYTF